MYLSRSQYDTKVEYGLVFPRCVETTQWSEELQVKMVQTSDRHAVRRSSTLDVDCCPMVVAHALKCSGPNLIIASTWFKEFYKQRDQVHFTTSVASDVEQRTSGPFFLCEDRVFVPSRLVTPVGKSSANRQMGGSKVFDSPFGGFHKWSYPNMVCKGKSEIEMDDN